MRLCATVDGDGLGVSVAQSVNGSVNSSKIGRREWAWMATVSLDQASSMWPMCFGLMAVPVSAQSSGHEDDHDDGW